MAWREVYKYLSIRIEEKEGEFDCYAAPRLSHWISAILFLLFLCLLCLWKMQLEN